MRLILGRSGTGKTYKCMHEIKDTLLSNFDKPIIYIVPEQFSFESEKKLIEVCGKTGIIGAQVLSFKRLAYRIFSNCNIKTNNLSDASKSMLIFFIKQKLNKEMLVLKANTPNIVKLISDEISEFKRYNINPELLVSLNTKNEYLNMKIHDLSLIYNEYEKVIKESYIDSNDELSILADVLASNNTYLDGAKIWIDEFDGFIPQELSIINELNKKCDVTISMISSEGDLFKLNNLNVSKIKENNTTEEIELKDEFRFNNSELVHLEKNIFDATYKKFNEEVEHIHIATFKNGYEEVEDIAKQILQYVRNNEYLKDLRYENIAILTRDVDRYKNIIKSIFPKFNIPYFIDDKKELSSEPLMLLVLSLLDIISNNYRYESMFSYLKTGLTNIEDENDIDLIENYVLKWGIYGKKWEEDFTIEDEELDKINNIRKSIIEPIISFKENFNGRKTVKEIAFALFEFLNKIDVFNTINKKVDSLKNGDGSVIRIAQEYAQVWNIMLNLLDEMVSIIGDEQVSFDSFKSIFKIGVSNYEIGVIPSTIDKVIIGDIERTRNSDIKVLFIIGFNEGCFPKNYSEEGFINDNERAILLENGIEVAKDTKNILNGEFLNIYKALCTASDSLYISYPSSDLEGKVLRKSFIISQIKSIFPKLKTYKSFTNNNIILSKEASFEIAINNAKICKEQGKDNGLSNLNQWYYSNENDKYLNTLKGLEFKNTIEYQSIDISKRLYNEEMRTSVSKLESYVACPFSFYLRYGLNLKEREVFKLGMPDVGSFLHEIIEIFTKKVINENIDIKNISKDDCNSIVSSITDFVLDNFRHNLFNSTGKLRNLSVKLKEQVKKVVWLIVNHINSGSFEIKGSEVEFGPDKEYPAIIIELDNDNKLVLQGKVDRIDVAKIGDDKYLRIVDYKSSDKSIKLSNIYYGIQLQLLAYSDAISGDDYKPGGIFYLKLSDPISSKDKRISKEEVEESIMNSLKMNGLVISNAKLIEAMEDEISLKKTKDGSYKNMPVVSEKDFSLLRKHMHNTLKQIGNEIMNGNVKNEPLIRKNSTSPCSYCPFVKVCRFDRSLGNKIRRLNELKDDVVINMINE